MIGNAPDITSSVPWFRLVLPWYSHENTDFIPPKFTILHQVPAGLQGFCSKPTCEIRTFEVQNIYNFHRKTSMPPRCLGQLSETFTCCMVNISETMMGDVWTTFLEERMGTGKPRTQKPSWHTISFQSLDVIHAYYDWIIFHGFLNIWKDWNWPFLPSYSFLGGKCCKTSSWLLGISLSLELAVEWRKGTLTWFHRGRQHHFLTAPSYDRLEAAKKWA